jgi:hypothetical protein
LAVTGFCKIAKAYVMVIAIRHQGVTTAQYFWIAQFITDMNKVEIRMSFRIIPKKQ